MITNAELWALNELNNGIDAANKALQRRICARDACVALLEGKYNAKFNPETGEFLPEDGAKAVDEAVKEVSRVAESKQQRGKK